MTSARTVNVNCDTPLDKLKKIPGIIQRLIEQMDLVEFERVHFAEFGAFSLNFQVIYYMKTDGFGKYMDIEQAINFGIIEAFEKEQIEMPFPKQTVISQKSKRNKSFRCTHVQG